MSGIAGITDFSNQRVDPQLLQRMSTLLVHRGPDSVRAWQDATTALAHFSMQSTSIETVHQPLVHPISGCVVVLDGRLDNWEELQRDLAAPAAEDAELVLLAYEQWGENFANKLDGDFALALWDPRAAVLHCARDIFGLRPLYYHWDGVHFAFASEIEPLRQLPWVTAALNEEVVAEWLSHEWHSRTETLWTGIRRLEPGHYLRVSVKQLKDAVHWSPDLHERIEYHSSQELIERYRELYFDCVRRVCRSHLPLAFEVSGGLDSSAAYAVALQLKKEGRLLAPSLRAFTLAFPPGPAYEVEYARAVGRHTGTPIEEIPPAYRSLFWYRERAKKRGDIAGIPNGVMNLNLLAAARASGARVIVTGLGGDEYTGVGTEGLYYADLIAQRQWNEIVAALRRDSTNLGITTTFWRLLRQGILPQAPENLKAWSRRWRGLGEPETPWLGSRLQALLRARRKRLAVPLASAARPGQRPQLRHFRDAGITHMLELANYHFSQAGLELRSPYYNKRMLQFALATGEWTRQQGNQHRWLHRQATAGLLPLAVLQRPDKADFGETLLMSLPKSRVGLLREIEARHPDWLNWAYLQKASSETPTYEAMTVCEWVVWFLFCIDAGLG